MAKGAFQSMRAAAEFIKTLDPTHVVSGWFVAGASKRGWTTWMVGAATCDSCVNIIGIAPLVPIVPSLQKEIHRMFQAYGGFTFAFADYQAINLTEHVDDPVFKGLTDVVDPINYLDRLARIPVYPVLSSDDEFMMMDWTNIWYDEMKAALPEMHLLIAPNSEHSLATGVPEVVESLQTFISSLAVGQTTRPNFEYTRHNKTGELSVKIDAGFTPTSVVLRHAQTLQTKRRDFRWIRLANEKVGTCTLPDIALPKPIFGANCLVPIVWYSEDVKLNADGEYKAKPPTPKPGHWAAYYIEVKFKSGTESISEYHFSTPGYTWPDTLPFHDCHGAGCIGPDGPV
jgi:PhoPQ-activated pathogenicity-related protein